MDKKKRGRKPKGGKLIESVSASSDTIDIVQNIILHLKCSSQEIKQSLNFNVNFIEPYLKEPVHTEIVDESKDISITQKLKNLAVRLHSNDISNRSDCFWCTCSYDSPTVYIPKIKSQDHYQVYGSFCCPECAAAYLFQEQLDSSTKFERYHLLNYLYCEVYNYAKNIIPAPPPFYLLNKYYGTLTIQEYRQLLRQDKIIFIANKPISSSYPELIQGTTDYNMCSIKSKPEHQYKLCRKIKSFA